MHHRAIVVLLAGALACTQGTETEPQTHEPEAIEADQALRSSANLNHVRRDLLAADAALSASTARQGLVDGLVPGFTGDVIFLTRGQPIIQGRREVAELLATEPTGTIMHWHALRTDVSADGRRGYTMGRAEITRPGAAVAYAKYLASWRKASSGEWRIAAYVRDASPQTADVVPPGFETPSNRHYASFPRPRGSAKEARLLDADRAFAALSVAQGAAAAFGAFAASDAVVLALSDLMVWGPEAILEYYTAAIPPTDQLDWTPLLADVAHTGDFGFTVGTGVYRYAPPDGPAQLFYSKYLTIWRRQAGGDWKYVADGGNSSPAP